MDKCEISLKGNLDYAGALALLNDIAKSFKDKTVCIQKGGEFVTLKPADAIAFEIEAQHKKGKQKLSLELTWYDEAPAAAQADFSISAKEPELPVAPEAPAAEPVAEDAPAACCASGKKAKDTKK